MLNTTKKRRVVKAVKTDAKDVSKKQRQNYGLKEKDEENLEEFLFGYPPKINNSVDVDEISKVGDKNDKESDLLSFVISTKADDWKDNDDDHTVAENNGNKDEAILPVCLKIEKKQKAAWSDPDDIETIIDVQNNKTLRKVRQSKEEAQLDGTIFQKRLKTQFEKILPAPAWADFKNIDDDVESRKEFDDDEDAIRKSGKIVNKSVTLEKGILSISRFPDIIPKQPENATITSLEFHPSAKIVLTSSLDKRLNIFQIDGVENKKLQTIHLSKFPIHNARFTPSGEKVIMTSRRNFYYSYDLIGGKVERIPGIRGCSERSLEKFVISPDGKILCFLGSSGYLHLLSSTTHQFMSSLKINGTVNAAAFSPDSSKLFSAGKDGEVYIWDMKSQRCLHRFVDDGSFSTTSLSVSPNGKYLACGSSSGVVNIYDETMHTKKNPTPLKILLNLTTRIHGAKFNSTSEVLAYYSPQIRNHLKLVHFPSLTTFSNWPVAQQTLGNVSCVDFSPLSGYLGIGNENGRALLFRFIIAHCIASHLWWPMISSRKYQEAIPASLE